MNKRHLEISPIEEKYLDDVARICYQSFHDSLGNLLFFKEFGNLGRLRGLFGMFLGKEDYYATVALIDGKPVGINILSLLGSYGGMGPLAVTKEYRRQGIGRALIGNSLEQAKKNNISQIGLQVEYSSTSTLGLYLSMGFKVRTISALMKIPITEGSSKNLRLATPSDLDSLGSLSKRLYRACRQSEISQFIQYKALVILKEDRGIIKGYFIPGVYGHGVAESVDDALALIMEAGRRSPENLACFFCPMKNAEFYQKALKAGCAVVMKMNYMAIDPYLPPKGTWMPSISF